MIYEMKSFGTDLDIVPNHIGTYPIELKKASSKEEFWTHLYQNKYNFICCHLTRLTKAEVRKIKKHGIKSGSKEHLIEKVCNLPKECNFFKKDMLKHVNDLTPNEINDKIYAYYGHVDLNSQYTSTPFYQNWGGEAIYNFYDHNDGYQDEFFKKVYTTLKRVSRPYLIVLKVTCCSFNDDYRTQKNFEAYKENSIFKVEGSIVTNSAKVVKLIDLTKNKIRF